VEKREQQQVSQQREEASALLWLDDCLGGDEVGLDFKLASRKFTQPLAVPAKLAIFPDKAVDWQFGEGGKRETASSISNRV
jgi:hypothetical protein